MSKYIASKTGNGQALADRLLELAASANPREALGAISVLLDRLHGRPQTDLHLQVTGPRSLPPGWAGMDHAARIAWAESRRGLVLDSGDDDGGGE